MSRTQYIEQYASLLTSVTSTSSFTLPSTSMFGSSSMPSMPLSLATPSSSMSPPSLVGSAVSMGVSGAQRPASHFSLDMLLGSGTSRPASTTAVTSSITHTSGTGNNMETMSDQAVAYQQLLHGHWNFGAGIGTTAIGTTTVGITAVGTSASAQQQYSPAALQQLLPPPVENTQTTQQTQTETDPQHTIIASNTLEPSADVDMEAPPIPPPSQPVHLPFRHTISGRTSSRRSRPSSSARCDR